MKGTGFSPYINEPGTNRALAPEGMLAPSKRWFTDSFNSGASARIIFPMNLQAIQAALREAAVDGWLFYDHHHRDPIAAHILGLDPKAHITRRWYYFIPAAGEPRKLVHRIEQGRLDSLPGSRVVYSGWQELAVRIEAMLSGFSTIAMQYSPNNDIMYVSMVDAGTVDFLRTLGKHIVSSADLVSQFEAVLTADQIATFRSVERQRSEQSEARAASESAYDLATQRYRAGITNYLTVLTAETAVLNQRRQSTDLTARALDAQIELIRALGGAFAPREIQ